MDHLDAANASARRTPGKAAPVDGLARALARDLDTAFERLVRSEADRCFSIARRLLGDPRDAEEVTQDAFLRAYRALASYEPARIEGLALRPWLAAIVVNLARNRRRRARTTADGRATARTDRHHHDTLLGDSMADPVDVDPAGSPEAALLRREAAVTWAALLTELPTRYRLPLVLRYVGDLSTSEVAAALGRPEGTVRAQLHRGLQQLRAAYLATDQDAAAERPIDEETR
ncbi:MAG: RNA polymerase sigma factor [Chloroflexota bacterium]|nr:MAG: RNA polymerase sigma factor [Chloroflexota bacterium]